MVSKYPALQSSRLPKVTLSNFGVERRYKSDTKVFDPLKVAACCLIMELTTI